MNPTGATTQTTAATAGEPRPGELHGDRLIAGLWIAMALALGRALLQAMVDWTADHEIGARLAEHLLEHLVDATGRVWIAVPVLAIVPRGRTRVTALLRAVVAFSTSVALLAGWPDGELRYRPGIDSTRGLQGWGVIAGFAIAIVLLDRYVTSPHRRLFGGNPGARFVVSAAVLLLGGGAIATTAYVLDRRRLNMEVEDIVFDLLDELPRARLTAGAGERTAESGSLVADKGDSIAGGNKPSLVVPVGGEVEFTVDLPRYTSLSFSYGVDRYSVRPKREFALTFAVAVDGQEILAETLEPQSRGADRGWVDRRVVLTVHDERHARIALRLRGTGEDLKEIRAGFGRPLLVRREWRPRVVADPAHLNVVLVVVDSMRPDHLGCYGATRPVSPCIDRLAADSIVYEDAQSPSSWTWPAVASLLTGLWPPSHGVTGFDRCYLSDSLETIAERFAQDGCTTLGVTASPFISHTKNFQQGFEEWLEFPLAAAPRLGEQFQDWVRRYSGYQFFAFVHFTDPRWPYNPPPRFGELFASPDDAAAMRHAVNELRAQRSAPADPSRGKGPVLSEEDVLPKLSQEARVGLYDGEIACVDYEIGRMWRALEDERLLDRTIFIVTSTHGELLAAGPAPAVGGSLDAQLLRVPLIVRDPRQRPRRERGVVDVTRLEPTLLRITGVDREEEAALPVPGGVTASTPLRPALPPWDLATPHVAFAHTSRARLPGRDEPCELVEISSAEGRLTMEPSGAVVEFSGDPKSAAGKEAYASLCSQVARWYEECRRSAVSRPFRKMDSATESLRDASDRN